MSLIRNQILLVCVTCLVVVQPISASIFGFGTQYTVSERYHLTGELLTTDGLVKIDRLVASTSQSTQLALFCIGHNANPSGIATDSYSLLIESIGTSVVFKATPHGTSPRCNGTPGATQTTTSTDVENFVNYWSNMGYGVSLTITRLT
jgi:hypothetical protein